MMRGKNISNRIRGIVFGDRAFTLTLKNGKRKQVSYFHFPKLDNATFEDRINVAIVAEGRILHWESLDEDISVEHILAGKYPVKRRAVQAV